ncbi:MAG TPA: 6,7-dimethyl-8-ribityllumazine synthase [Gaiellaceae bacterium]|nr:6,7-dimethyl-8-ribityllumazine synthase [Gaiellaceae bacterium]
MSDGLDQPRLRLGQDPDEERREDVTELADEPEASPEPEATAEAEPEVEEPGVEEPEAESVPEPSWEPEPKKDEEAPAEEDELPRLRAPEHAPGELQIPDGYGVIEGSPSGSRRAVGIVVARFNGQLTSELLTRALDELERAGVGREAVTVIPVPGAFELPLAAMALAKTRRYSCIVALGAVVRGETPHFEYVAGEAASGLQLAGLETGVPVSFGVLTTDTEEQARERLEKGAEAVRTALEMADVFSQLRAAAGAAAP